MRYNGRRWEGRESVAYSYSGSIVDVDGEKVWESVGYVRCFEREGEDERKRKRGESVK